MSKKKKLIYQNIESLQPIVNVVNDAAVALDDKTRTIKESAIPEVVAGALGAGSGGVREVSQWPERQRQCGRLHYRQ